jgi:hypothetical protein
MKLNRRHFLRGVGGVTLGLPLLEAFLPRRARAAPMARSPFAIFVVHSNGVVQAGTDIKNNPDPEWYWPSTQGPLTTAGLVADLANKRATGVLSDYASRMLMVRGISHAFAPQGCAHAAADATVLTATNPINQSGSAGTARANGESIDNRIARQMNPVAGQGPLLLKAGNFSAGGMGYDVPGFVSYAGAGQPNAYTDSPYQAYLRMIGIANVNSAQAMLIASRRMSVNDLLRGQINALLARTDLTADDRTRLDQHLTAVRDLEVSVTATLPDATISQMKMVDPQPYDDAAHETLVHLAHDLMVFAMSVDYTRSAVLRVGDRIDLYHFPMPDGSMSPEYHLCSHRDGGANSLQVCGMADQVQVGWFKSLLDKLSAVTMVDGTKLIDAGVTVLTNQIANGAHSFNNVPFVLTGTANGYLRTGMFVDLATPVTTNRMLNTLLNAAGVRNSDGSPVDNFGSPGQTPGVISEILA